MRVHRVWATTLMIGVAFAADLPLTTGTYRAEAPGVVSTRDTHERLHGVLWMQTAAEFWSLTWAAYESAKPTVDAALKDRFWTAALEQSGSFETLPAAVILDLDETVLDNAPAQGQLVIDRTDYTPTNWDRWVAKASAPAIPGAIEFLKFVDSKGVKIFFVTNRTKAEEAKTLANLSTLGISATDDTVLCTGENGWTSDKTARRAEVAKNYRILMLVGDDLNDFVSTAKLAPADRVALAQTHKHRWGTRWILLPNPLYGSWERALYPGLTKDDEILKKKHSLVVGF